MEEKKLGLRGIVTLIMATFLTTALGGVAVAAVGHYLLQSSFGGQDFFFYEILLPLVLVYGVVSLLIALAVMAVVLANFDLGNKEAALGLPEGSVRSVLAISLVLIFIITALYVYSRETGKAEPSQTTDLAAQLTTTVGTLAVAVAGFYFGSKAVEAGAAAARPSSTDLTTVRILSPTSPAHQPGQGEGLDIVVETVPRGQSVNGRLYGDDGGRLEEISPSSGRWRYTPGPNPDASVLARFNVVNHPGKEAVLEISASPPGST